MRTCVILATALACGACGPKASRPSTSASIACPTDDELVAYARQHWHLADDATVTTVCAPGHFGVPGWYVVAKSQSADDTDTARYRVVLSTARAAIAELGAEPIDFRSDLVMPELHVIDLDGDGVDEILEQTRHDEGAVGEGWLNAYAIHDGALVEAKTGVPLDYSVPDDSVHCTGTVTVTGAAVTITTTVTGPAGDHCLTAGVHHLHWSAGDLTTD